MRKLFGTDGIRGTANKHPITIKTCLKLAKAIVAKFFNIDGEKPLVIIGKDTRISGDIFEHALAAAFSSLGANVQLLGVIPTPAVSILVPQLNADFGIVISASHNVFSDNGIKLFNKFGLKLKDYEEVELEFLMNEEYDHAPTGTEVGKITQNDSALQLYQSKIKNSFHFPKTDLKIVVDSSNGALSKIAPVMLKEFGFNVASIFDAPNGTNINANCGVTHPRILADAVLEYGADIGIAFDGDGDRVILSDEKGSIIDGDHLLAILVSSEKHTEIVSTIMSNFGFEKYLSSKGIKLIRTDVGDRYISEYMQKSDANLGGEPSGHIIIKSHALTGDGLFAGLKAIECIIKSNAPCSKLAQIFESYPTVSNNVKVSDKSVISQQNIVDAIENYKKQLLNRGKLIVRPSGTEPIIRISAEGENASELEEIVTTLSNLIGNVA